MNYSFRMHVFVQLVALIVLSALMTERNFTHIRHDLHNDTKKHYVNIWVPHGMSKCQGMLRAKTKSQKVSDPYALVVREATVDWRHRSIIEARRKGVRGPYRRIVVFMSILPNARGSNYTEIEKSFHRTEYPWTAYLESNSKRLAKTINVQFDYLIEQKRCQIWCGRFGRCVLREWQAIVTFKPRLGTSEILFSKNLNKLVESSASLHLSFHVLSRLSGKSEKIDISIALACVASLGESTQLPNTLPMRSETCAKAKGALAIAGAPIFGNSLRNHSSSSLIAHYAARHLYGHTWFDNVVVAVHPKHSISEIMGLCAYSRKRSSCISKYHKHNLEHLHQTRAAVEVQLKMIGVPQKDWPKIIIFSICNLGTDFEVLESNFPCEATYQGGQKLMGYFGFTVFAPYFKWSSNIDIDEFLVDELAPVQGTNSRSTRHQSAESRFNLLTVETGKKNFYANWLDFAVKQEHMISLTQNVMHGRQLSVRSIDHNDLNFNVNDCRGGGGRTIASCHNSLSFEIHSAIISRKHSDLSKTVCAPKRNRIKRTAPNETEIYIWHARNPARQGKCSFLPQ